MISIFCKCVRYTSARTVTRHEQHVRTQLVLGLFNVLNNEFVASFIGLVPAHLPRSHSLQYAHASSAVAVLSVDAIFVN